MFLYLRQETLILYYLKSTKNQPSSDVDYYRLTTLHLGCFICQPELSSTVNFLVSIVLKIILNKIKIGRPKRIVCITREEILLRVFALVESRVLLGLKTVFLIAKLKFCLVILIHSRESKFLF